MRLLWIIVLAVWCFSCLTGQGTNPFEIPEGPGDLPAQDSNAVIEESMNPFEIRSKPTGFTRGQTTITTPTQHLRSGQESVNQLLVLIYVLASFFVLALGISINRKRYQSMLRAQLNSNYLKTLFRAPRAWSDVQTILLYLLFMTNMAMVLWVASLRWEGKALGKYYIILIVIASIYLVRHVAMWIFSRVYKLDQAVDIHNYSIAVHNIILGACCLPIILSLGYVSEDDVKLVLWVWLGFFGLSYVLRQAKGLFGIVSTRGFNPVYFFIYLCAFEFAPLLIAWRVISGPL